MEGSQGMWFQAVKISRDERSCRDTSEMQGDFSGRKRLEELRAVRKNEAVSRDQMSVKEENLSK